MIKILGLDISSRKTGVAVISNGRLSKKSLTTIEPNSKKSYGERLSYFREELQKLVSKHNPDYIVVEDIFKGRNINTFKILAMWRGVALQIIYECTGKSPIILMPTEARAMIGAPTSKEDAFDFIINKYKLTDFNFDDHNDMVDAVGLASAMHTMIKQGIDEKSLSDSRRKKRRKRRRSKKSIQKAGTKKSP